MSESNAGDDADALKAAQRKIEELEAQLAAVRGEALPSAANTVHSGGGAVVAQGVQVGNGHFIGRDYIASITQIVQSGDDQTHVENLIALYLHVLSHKLAGLRLGEIDSKLDSSGRDALQLGDVYVPLNTTLRIDAKQHLKDWLEHPQDELLLRSRELQSSQRELRPVSVLEALAAHPTLTLLGQPGGGKSSFGARVLLALAEVWRGEEAELAHLGDTWAVGGLFPIHIVLREFADQLPPGDAPARAGDLWAFLGRELGHVGVGFLAEDHRFLQRLALSHGALVVFDGLDECGSPARRARVRAAVDEFIHVYAKHGRFVLTARPYAWPGGPDPARGVYMLDAFDDSQIVRFIETWYTLLPRRRWCTPSEAERKCSELLAVRDREDLRPLAPNPLLLTLMALLHSNRHTLPDDRVDLYDESVLLLLQRWNPASAAEQAMFPMKLADMRDVLQKVAFELHQQSAGQHGDLDLGEGRLLAAFSPLLDDSRDHAMRVLEFIERRAGLLLGQGEHYGERQFRFPHRTFQEYLAACHLAAKNDFTALSLTLAYADAGHWTVVLTLAARVAKLDRGAAAAHALVGCRAVEAFRSAQGRSLGPAEWRLAQLAGSQLAELGSRALNARDDTKTILHHVRGWLAAALPVHPDDGGLPAPLRAQIGDLLATLGDPRFDPTRLHLSADDQLGFVHVHADPLFRIGTRSADRQRVAAAVGESTTDDEINDTLTPTPEFWIARYPVTVAQFRAFVEDSDFAFGDADALRDADTRPVCWVSWAEAAAYAAWLQRQLCESPVFDAHPVAALVRAQGWQVMLPSERVWEKAARGGRDGAVFPWGDVPDTDRANIADSGIGGTSAVGAFPANDYGLYDMAGNVWEWTSSAYRETYARPEQIANASTKSIVVRGGGWSHTRFAARCAYRYWDLPDVRYGSLGFRVVLCCSPVR